MKREAVERAAAAIAAADAVLIGAGAGMGVDSGLPDFRGPEGFWRAYPALRRRRVRFEEMANPRWFDENPGLAWAFYGHRLQLYRDTVPHAGFALLQELAGDRPLFVYTSNVDGQFQRAGFEEAQVFEVHGSIHHLQRTDGMGTVWSAEGVTVDIDAERFLARAPLPLAPDGSPARPNVLMFGDGDWIPDRAAAQQARYQSFLADTRGVRRVAIELGAGTAIPTVRWECARQGTSHVRINPRESHGPPGTIGLAAGALEALQAIAELM